MRFSTYVGLFIVSAMVAACDVCGDKECNFTKNEWSVVQTLSPLPPPAPDPTNRFTTDDPNDPAVHDQHERSVTLGKKLFWDPRYSTALKVASTLGAVGDVGKVGCESCHKSTANYVDVRSVPNNMSVGVSWTLRNAPSLVNQVYYEWHNWSGNRRTLWEQAGFSPETGTNTAGDRCTYAHMLWDFYRDEYNALVPDAPLSDRLDPASPEPIPAKCRPKANAMAADGAWEMFNAQDAAAGRPENHTRNLILQIMCTQGKFVASYESLLVSRNAPFDQYVAGDENAISLSAKRGLRLFVGKAACANCHLGPFFTDQKFHNIGVPQTGPNVPATDNGRIDSVKDLPTSACRANGPFSDDPSVTWLDGLVEGDEADRGAFRTPTLRNVSQSAPYMHTGGLATLRDVVHFYNRGGETVGFAGTKHHRIAPLGLTESEIDELVAFLMTLTGEAIPEELTATPTLPTAAAAP